MGRYEGSVHVQASICHLPILVPSTDNLGNSSGRKDFASGACLGLHGKQDRGEMSKMGLINVSPSCTQ